ncbi:MAG TPA: tellurite resistance TerB family protein [Azospirillaceae bacterium]|nr:tellurite resistance TerB family protein [Azospirillaceae bacterium]
MIDHHSALIYTMVLVSAADADMTDAELLEIGENIRYMPVFKDFDIRRLPEVAEECTALLADPDGLEKILDLIKEKVPHKLRETAYAVACDIVAADGQASQEELRILEILRHRLEVDRLCAAAIERGAKARHATL